MKTRTVALLVAIGLILTLSGCQTKEQGYILKTAAEELPVGAYIYWQVLNTREALYLVPENTTAATLWSQSVEGEPLERWVSDRALRDTKRMIATESLFDEMGLKLSDTTRADLDDWNETQWTNLGKAHEQSGISKSSFSRVNESLEKQRALFLAIYSKGGSAAIPEEEVAAYLTENYARFSYMHFAKPTDAAPARSEAQRYYDRALSGESFYDLMDEKNKVERAPGEARNEDDYYYIASRTFYGTFPAELIDAIYNTPIGGVGITTLGEYTFVFNRQDPMANEQDMADLDYTLRRELRNEAFEALLDARAEEMFPAVSEAAIRKFPPSKLNLASL